MTDKATIENQISNVKKYLQIVAQYEKYSVNEIKTIVDVRGAVERYLYLLTQATIDLGESIVAYRGLRKPTTMSDVFHILHEDKLIDDTLLEKMISMTGFRNVIAHDYQNIDYDIVSHVIHEGTKDTKEFIKIIEREIL